MTHRRMLTDSLSITFLALLGILMTSTQSFAQVSTTSALTNNSITVSTDKTSYNEGDPISISGKVNGQLSNSLISIRIENPSTNLVAIAQLQPSYDGSFSKTVDANGPLWTTAGNYTIIALYGPNISTTTTFYFTGGSGQSTIKIVTPPSVSNSTIPANPIPASSSPANFNVTHSKIPSWIKNIFIWYGRGSISDDELLGAIKYLIQQGIIQLK